ncbi:uncharacterized protein, PH0010 family/AmmeMemoRadiSam system protein A/AmmeMemoRadiSam system protein B [Acetitomaculum ruminis DSM 5522]|uniref:Uncharacterized protein, PH0010 family/AmmeMemoRadiSam system protein A/AmmeMemoRadiSam system protein B n=2 Tax=Acetitomaculum ruminis TaxID=2382 RepID=A0A1I0V167_9FIRM|nr:uncharacterized protein, PH0010 family/AmmeMemoRadiSam system protein A/AmmeMemoRadiSam system protein B [Acetitomaculum ruminis DSM 5522]
MSILGGIMVPHPPLIIPEVGKGGEKQIEKTRKAYEEASKFIAELEPETIVLISPHSVMYADYLHISPGYEAKGNLSAFGAGQVKFSVRYDSEFSNRLCELAEDFYIPAGYLGEKDKNLDHGSMVPLYFIQKQYSNFEMVRIGISGISLEEQYQFGSLIKRASKELNKKVAIVASGDLSHKLKHDGPYGFDEAGPVYDEKIMNVMGRAAFEELLEFDPVLLEKSAECGHRSFVIMAGAFDKLSIDTTVYSHEDVTGVGYGVCSFRVLGTDESRDFFTRHEKKEEKKLADRKSNEDEYVSLARLIIENYVDKGELMDLPGNLPEEMYENKAGVFVSLHMRGQLRGCIGTICPTTDSVAEEICQNAISACARDPRFNPVTKNELKYLEYSVDVLGQPEDISSTGELDVKKYGVIVTKGSRRGLLLPDLEGVDSVDEQISIAKRKASIGEYEKDVKLQRFEVIRHY